VTNAEACANEKPSLGNSDQRKKFHTIQN